MIVDTYDRGLMLLAVWRLRTLEDVDLWQSEQHRHHRVLPLLVQDAVFKQAAMIRARSRFNEESRAFTR